MAALIGLLTNRDSKYNKFILAAYAATILFVRQIGYPDVADHITIIGAALGLYLVGNPKEVVVVSPERPTEPEDPSAGA